LAVVAVEIPARVTLHREVAVVVVLFMSRSASRFRRSTASLLVLAGPAQVCPVRSLTLTTLLRLEEAAEAEEMSPAFLTARQVAEQVAQQQLAIHR
jgi:hypothetical protein